MEKLTVVNPEYIRQLVAEVAADMVSLIGIVEPILGVENNRVLGAARQPVGRILRKTLIRNVVLCITRLYEDAYTGKTGETASIDGLLKALNGTLPDERIDELRAHRQRLLAELESAGIRYSDIYAFRTASIAHSIHRDSIGSVGELTFRHIVEFAHKTYELVLQIEQEIAVAGGVPFADLPDLIDVWERRGSEFWKPFTTSNASD